MDLALLKQACQGDAQAEAWLVKWTAYVHLVDDIVDEDMDKVTRGAQVCAMGATALELYSHPFYLANVARLGQVALNCTNAFADVIPWEAWEGVDGKWKERFADVYRHFGCEMVLAVASIKGGYNLMRAISEQLRVMCWTDHQFHGKAN